MASIKRASNKPINRVRDLSTATRILITGNGNGAVVQRIQKDIDSFLDDLEAFDAALWKVIHQNKDRLYKFLDMIGDRGTKKKSEGPVGELKEAWNRLVASSGTLGHDAKIASRQLRRKAERRASQTQDAVSN